MSNSTRQGGYDERLVVPLEASRRGAHRARVNPVVAALPLLAVVAVVALVIGVAYTLFFNKTSTSDDVSAPSSTASAPAPTGSSSPVPSAGRSSSAASPTASASASTTPPAKVDKTLAFAVYNGSVGPVSGLAGRAATSLKTAGFSGGTVQTSPPTVSRSRTTRIYYASATQKATAEAIKEALGVGVVKLSSSVAGQSIVVVVGNDYSA